MQTVTVPFIDYQIRAFNATMIVAGVVMILFFAIYFTLYAGLYRLMGPSPYGPTDVPPVRRKGRSRKSR